MKIAYPHYKTPEECPAYVFYKADEDVRWLLHDNTKEVSAMDEYALGEVLIELKEWFNSKYNKNAYQSNLNDLTKKTKLEIKLTALNAILSTLNAVNVEKLSEFMSDENIKGFKEVCKSMKLAHMDIRKDMISQIERVIKGVTNDYNRVLTKFKDRNVEFNYMRECINVSRALGVNRDPMKITLVEWLEMLKLANELS